MAITTLDGIIAGLRPPEGIMKTGGTMELAGIWHSLWYTAGRPGAAAANAAGVNGRACTPAVVGGGFIPRVNPGAGNAYLARLAAVAGLTGSLMLIDRLWENSGLSTTLTTAQAITPAAIPARDRDGSTNGEDVLAAVEWSATGGAGTPTVTLTYTDQSGNTGATGTVVGQATPQAGTFEIFNLAAGDTGIRAPTSFQQSATRTSGTQHLVLFRILALLQVAGPAIPGILDAVTAGMPRIYNDSVLQLLWLPSATTAINLTGQYIETQG